VSHYNVLDRTALANLQPEDISKVLENLDAIASTLNGALGDDNFDPAQPLADNKIDFSSSTKILLPSKIRTDGPGGPFVGGEVMTYDVATDVVKLAAFPGATGAALGTKISELGTPVDGRIGRLRLAPATALNVGGGLALPAAVVTARDTLKFADMGTLETPNGTVTYTGKTPTTFTGCTGGAGTLPQGAVIRQLTVTGGATIQPDWDILPLSYDSTLAKWVSSVERLPTLMSGTPGSLNTWIDYNTFSTIQIAPIWGWRAYDAAGLTPQLRFIGETAHNSSTATIQLRPAWWAVDAVDNIYGSKVVAGFDLAAASAATAIINGSIGSGGRAVYTRWGTLPGGYTLRDFFLPGLQVQQTAGTTGLSHVTVGIFEVRWIG
jgi:hypothetical protein